MSRVGGSRRVMAAAVPALLVAVLAAAASVRWGYHGHEISGRAAATDLPAAMPAFFRTATAHMEYLNPEPDRWRGDRFHELNVAMQFDHYIDLEAVPEGALDAPDRFKFLYALQEAGLENPAGDAGLLPFRIVELYQSLVVEWKLWRGERDPAKRRMIEQRILNDAGILGHYVADGANPHHTTVHYDRWLEDYPNPRGFTTERGFHRRFESIYVENNIETADILPHVNARPRVLEDVRVEVMAYILRSHSRLERLYGLDLVEAFGPDTQGAEHRDFAIERLVAGVNMLRDLWWSAWVQSGMPEPARER